MIVMGQKLRKLFQSSSSDDIDSIENGLNDLIIKCYDIGGQNDFKCREISASVEDSSCEEICTRLCKKLGLGFSTSQLVGLQRKDSESKLMKWLNPRDSPSIIPSKEVCLRVRHIPTLRGCGRLKELDRRGLEYIYFQVSDDFLHENLQLEGNIEKSDGLGLVTLSLLIKLRLETELRSSNSEDLDHFLRATDVTLYVPKSFVSGNIIDKQTLKRSILRQLNTLHSKYPAGKYSSKDLMKCYLEHILKKDVLKLHFYEESFQAKKVSPINSSTADVAAVVDKGPSPEVKLIDKQSGSIYFSCSITDLRSLEVNVRSFEAGTFFEVQIGHVLGIPESVYFPLEADAESFITCLESFSRLTSDYYGSLCLALAPNWFREMSQARIHGPSSIDYLQRILQMKSDGRGDRYILYKSYSAYDEYGLLCYSANGRLQTKHVGKVVHTERGYELEGQRGKPVEELKMLLRKEVINNSLVNRSSIPLKPQAEVCDTIYQLLIDSPVPKLVGEEEIEEEGRKKLKQHPKVYLPSDLEIVGSFGLGYFTEVQKALLCEDDLVVVKSLRLSEIPSEHQHTCFKALQAAMTRQMTLKNPAPFVGFVGVVLDSPMKMILKYTDYGSLKDFLRNREPTMTLHLQHLNEATLNIADALLYMESKNLYHGNLNCSNVCVAKYDSNNLMVKVADPGMVTLYNQMPLDSEVNRKRVPWLSPKLFANWADPSGQTRFSIQTDVYALGTTLWEMFNNCWGPLDVGQQLYGWTQEKILEFFTLGKHLDCPVYLQELKSDPDGIKSMKKKMFEKIIKQCWELKEEEMVLPNRIVKDINLSIGNYGKYNEYAVIYYSDCLPADSGSLPNTSGTTDVKSLVYQRQMKIVPDLSCLQGSGKRHVQQLVIDREQTIPKTLEEDFEQTHVKTVAKEPVLLPSFSAKEQTTPKAVAKDSTDQTQVKTVANGPHPQLVTHDVPPPRPPMPNAPQTVPVVQLQPSKKQQAPKKPVVKHIRYIISEDRLKLDLTAILGQGHYGAVFKGELAPLSSTGRSVPEPVAVKRLKPEMLEKYGEDFRKEIGVMEQLEHKNIVKFIGVCRGEEFIVMEFLDGGSLYGYVSRHGKESREIPQSQFIRFSLDVARGMAYLWSKKVLHMDLACRNVLLTRTLCAKVSDFGLSKLLIGSDKDYYRRMPGSEKTIPMLWCALEWLSQTRFTTKCDVWSFGITMWEMCSYGKKPNICKDELEFQKEGYHRLKKGERLPPPRLCLPELYQLMFDCWKENADSRPEFEDCVLRLDQLYSPKENQNRTSGASASSGVGSNGDKQSRLQKSGSRNSDAAGESSDNEDYHKMTAGSTANDQAGAQQAGDATGAAAEQTAPVPSKLLGETIADASLQAEMTVTSVEQTTAASMQTKSDEMTSTKQTKTDANGLFQDNRTEYEPSVKEYFINERDIEVTEECLGKGSYGNVMKGILKRKTERVAVAVKIFDAGEALYGRFKREMQLLGIVNHQNIVQFKGAIKGNGRTEQYVMELMGNGDLTTYLRDKAENISLRVRLGFLLDIAEGMSHLSERSILHCDLTAANILLSHDLVAKISDFGLSKLLDKDKNETGVDHYKRNDARFKLLWSAPEVFRKEVYTRFSDNWSFGVLCLEVFLSGKILLFKGKDYKYWEKNMDQYGQYIEGGCRFDKPKICPQEVYELIKQCWSIFPDKRIKFDEVIETLRSAQAFESISLNLVGQHASTMYTFFLEQPCAEKAAERKVEKPRETIQVLRGKLCL